MSSLATFQQQFIDYLYQKDTDNFNEDHISPHPISASKRLQIYQDNLFINLGQALLHTYPLTSKFLDERFFRFAAHEYIKSTPSQSGNVSDYGASFPDFLGQFEPANHLPYLSDFARLEWHHHLCNQAPNIEYKTSQAIDQLTEDAMSELCFNINPACIFFTAAYPIDDLWDFCQSPQEQPPSMEQMTTHLMIFRNPDNTTQHHRLTQEAFTFLSILAKGKPLLAAYEAASASDEAFDFSQLLQHYIGKQVLITPKVTTISP